MATCQHPGCECTLAQPKGVGRKTGRTPKYCPAHAKERQLKQQVKWMADHRAANRPKEPRKCQHEGCESTDVKPNAKYCATCRKEIDAAAKRECARSTRLMDKTGPVHIGFVKPAPDKFTKSAISDEAQRELDAEITRRHAIQLAPCRKLTPEEIAAVAPGITPVHLIPEWHHHFGAVLYQ